MILNKVKSEGNSIYIRSNAQTGILALTSFVDNTTGEDVTNYFTKEFRYSVDGIEFTEWIELTISNITSITVNEKDTIVIELRYDKNPVGNQSISVSEATINTTNATLVESYYFKNSIFSEFFGSSSIEVLNWTINVLEKIYQKGLIPNYIGRYNDNNTSEDFINFWKSVCKFFAYYVIYARTYQTFYQKDSLIHEYLDQRGISISERNTLDEMNYIMQNFYNEIFKRGTAAIAEKKSDTVNVDGELLRLIFYKENDEFIFNFNKQEHFSWWVDNCSPLYRSLTKHDNANKFYERQSEPEEITNYPIQGDVTIITDNTINKKVLKLNNASIEDTTKEKLIVIDPHLDYEFSLRIKKEAGSNLTIGFDAYDINKNKIDLLAVENNSVKNDFLTNSSLQRQDKYITIDFCLYSQFKPVKATDKVNLKLTKDVCYIAPRIKINNAVAYIYNIRLLPLFTPYSKGFVQSTNFIDCWVKNNNHKYNYNQLREFTSKYLIPYNANIELINLEKTSDLSKEVAEVKPLQFITLPASEVGLSSAKLGGNIINDGGYTVMERGIVWSTSTNPTINNAKVSMGVGSGQFSQTISDFPQGKVIFVKAYLINQNGIFYANEISFNTATTVMSIKIVGNSLTNADSVDFVVKFSNSITGLSENNFELVCPDLTGCSITSVTGSADTYSVSVNTGTGDGNLRLDFVRSNDLSPAVGNYPFQGESYLIDKTLPLVFITSKPESNSKTRLASFEFYGTDANGISKYQFSLDGSPFADVTSPKTFNNLVNGSHTFRVRAIDKAGNVGYIESYVWTISVNEFLAEWGSSDKQFMLAEDTANMEEVYPREPQPPYNKWTQRFQISGVPLDGTVYTVNVYGNTIEYIAHYYDTAADVVANLSVLITDRKIVLPPMLHPPTQIVARGVGDILEIDLNTAIEATVSVKKKLTQNPSLFTYQGSGTFTDSIQADFRTTPQNKYLICRYPKNQTKKTHYYNSVVYNGNIPDETFTAFDDDDYNYIASLKPVTLDNTKYTIFSS